MTERRRLVKLVRDRVAHFIGGDTSVSYEPVPREIHGRLLREKLIEEAIEYAFNPSIGEAADVLQALKDAAKLDLDAELHDVELEAANKYAERGGFSKGTGMYCTTTAPPTHEGEHADG